MAFEMFCRRAFWCRVRRNGDSNPNKNLCRTARQQIEFSVDPPKTVDKARDVKAINIVDKRFKDSPLLLSPF
jgi:hypothetical protein